MATEAVRMLEVAAGLLLTPDGQLLLGRRPEGKSYAGWWELPGGKIEPGETPRQALERELCEELGITVTRATPWVTHVHEYPQTIVRLAFHRVTAWSGEPRGMEGQRLQWVNPQQPIAEIEAELGGSLLPATLPPLSWLQVPAVYVICALEQPTDVPALLRHVAQAVANGARLFQFRAPGWVDGPAAESLHAVMRQVMQLVHASRGRLLVNSAHPADWWRQADGVHLRSADLLAPPDDLPAEAWVGASTHNAEELAHARAAGARFAVLGPVLDTPSHPEVLPLGWPRFAELAQAAGLPVFALGGQSANTFEQAVAMGAHGIAGIRHAAVACRVL